MYKYLTKKSICHSIYHKSTTILARKCKPKTPKPAAKRKQTKRMPRRRNPSSEPLNNFHFCATFV